MGMAQEVIYEGTFMILDELKELGFCHVGNFYLDENKLNFKLFNSEIDIGVYAFSIGGEIKYIGKTDRGLKGRMNGYKNPGPTQFTNQRLNPKLTGILKEGLGIEIWFKPYVSLENMMIQKYNPEWNQQLKQFN